MSNGRGKDHWRRLVQALGLEAQEIHGFGSITVKVTFVDGLPMQVDTLERHCTRRLDREQPPVELQGSQSGAGVV